MRVAIVIPTKNEEKVLEANIRRLADFLAVLDRADAYSIIIADNGSTDGTAALAAKLSRELPGVSWFHLDQPGRGRALKQAWLGSDADVVGYMDADLSTELEALPRALAASRAGADIAVGSRLLRASRIGRSWYREFVSRTYNFLRRRLLRSPVADTQCGFKFLRRETAREILPLAENDKWFFDTELLFLAAERGRQIKEIPVAWAENRKSTVKVIPTAVEEFRGVLRLRRQARARRQRL